MSGPANTATVHLNPDLLIGTGRSFRDDQTGRKDDRDDYLYAAFGQVDYEEMVAAGANYFIATRQQIEWIHRRPVFYTIGRSLIAPHSRYDERTKLIEDITAGFPEDLYRPNFMGCVMFLDEPAARTRREHQPDISLEETVSMLGEHIREYDAEDRDYGRKFYRAMLLRGGVALGTLGLVEPRIPIWEAYICTSYYQLEIAPYGMIHESRWQIGSEGDFALLQRVNAAFGTSIPIEPESLFLWHFSQIIGAARVFGGKWGMAIYGQAEPELRLPADERPVKLAPL